jgi:GNAT superfamily N-acetyltransferase
MSLDLEAVERGELQSLHDAAPTSVQEALGLRCETVGGALLSVAARLPATAIVVNRVIGLGLTEPADPATVDAVIGRYRAAGVARYFVHVHPDSRPSELRTWLLDRGLERTRSWVKFTRGREAPPEITSAVEVRRARPDDMPTFARVAAAAFDLGTESEPWLARLGGARGWHAYVGFDGGEVVATGGLYVHDRIGWLDFGATRPASRGRGAQSALLRQRILDALDLGCSVIATATGEAVPGDPQHSYKNIKKMGFFEAYTRNNYAPPRHT